MSNSSIWPIVRTIRYFYFEAEWTWEWWQWRCTPHFLNLQDWSLVIRLLNVMSRTHVGGRVLTLCKDAVSVFYSPPPPANWPAKRMNLLALLLESKLCRSLSISTHLCDKILWRYHSSHDKKVMVLFGRRHAQQEDGLAWFHCLNGISTFMGYLIPKPSL